ncbi:hypothetical protein LguiA_031853 [Lonicera macranthoides]
MNNSMNKNRYQKNNLEIPFLFKGPLFGIGQAPDQYRNYQVGQVQQLKLLGEFLYAKPVQVSNVWIGLVALEFGIVGLIPSSHIYIDSVMGRSLAYTSNQQCSNSSFHLYSSFVLVQLTLCEAGILEAAQFFSVVYSLNRRFSFGALFQVRIRSLKHFTKSNDSSDCSGV